MQGLDSPFDDTAILLDGVHALSLFMKAQHHDQYI